jgi:hypothetical protein
MWLAASDSRLAVLFDCVFVSSTIRGVSYGLVEDGVPGDVVPAAGGGVVLPPPGWLAAPPTPPVAPAVLPPVDVVEAPVAEPGRADPGSLPTGRVAGDGIGSDEASELSRLVAGSL